MSTAEQWAGVLGGQRGEPFTLRFDRLGLEAQCRPLQAGEVEECVRMGGERGLRYALYLACEDLREAGESLKKQGVLASAFDITEKLGYGDVLAAGAAILGRSGANDAQVQLDGQAQELPRQQALTPVGAEPLLPGQAEGVYPASGLRQAEGGVAQQSGWLSAGQIAQDFADSLWAAAGNR